MVGEVHSGSITPFTITVKSSFNWGGISGDISLGGGLIGRAGGDGAINVTNCYNTGNVNMDGDGSGAYDITLSGLVGFCDRTSSDRDQLTLTNCYSVGVMSFAKTLNEVDSHAQKYFSTARKYDLYQADGLADGPSSGTRPAHVNASGCYNASQMSSCVAAEDI